MLGSFAFFGPSLLLSIVLPLTLAVPVEMVPTPGGLRPKVNVHAIPPGGHLRHVGDYLHIVDSAGKVVQITHKDSSPQYSSPHAAITNNSTTSSAQTKTKERSGWITYAEWINYGDAPINYFTTTWTVPEKPLTNNKQLVYLFNALEPVDPEKNGIAQPVLQYGVSPAGGSHTEWGVASWYLVGSNVFHTDVVPVSPGQFLVGVLQLENSDGVSFNYTSWFTNIKGTRLPIVGAQELIYATETLEAYGITTGTDYPSGQTIFGNITLQTTAGTPDMTWRVTNDLVDGVTTEVTRDGPIAAEVVVSYPSPSSSSSTQGQSHPGSDLVSVQGSLDPNTPPPVDATSSHSGASLSIGIIICLSVLGLALIGLMVLIMCQRWRSRGKYVQIQHPDRGTVPLGTSFNSEKSYDPPTVEVIDPYYSERVLDSVPSLSYKPPSKSTSVLPGRDRSGEAGEALLPRES